MNNSGSGFASGLVMVILGVWVLLRTVRSGQSRSLVDVIMGTGASASVTSGMAGAPAAVPPQPHHGYVVKHALPMQHGRVAGR